MKNPIADLSLEHAAFLRFLDSCEDSLNSSKSGISANKLKIFFFLLEKVHHAKEEELLFPLLFGTETVNVGGPKCMTFFTPRAIGANWKDSFQDLKEILGPPALALNPFREAVFQSSSMLKIPIEDHMLGAMAAKLLTKFGSEALSAEEWALLFRKFSALLRDHIQREEECLLPMFRKALSEQQLALYETKAKALDERLGTSSLLLFLENDHKMDLRCPG